MFNEILDKLSGEDAKLTPDSDEEVVDESDNEAEGLVVGDKEMDIRGYIVSVHEVQTRPVQVEMNGIEYKVNKTSGHDLAPGNGQLLKTVWNRPVLHSKNMLSGSGSPEKVKKLAKGFGALRVEWRPSGGVGDSCQAHTEGYREEDDFYVALVVIGDCGGLYLR